MKNIWFYPPSPANKINSYNQYCFFVEKPCLSLFYSLKLHCSFSVLQETVVVGNSILLQIKFLKKTSVIVKSSNSGSKNGNQ